MTAVAPQRPDAPPGVAAKAEGLRKVYGTGAAAVEALRGVSIEFETGEFSAIMGASGSGKSTLLHCLAGLDTPSEGRVFIGDVDIMALDEKHLTRLRRDKIGFVTPEADWLRSALAELVAHVKRGGAKRLAVERFDGEPVGETMVMPLLVEAGFLAGPRRAVLRA